MATLAFSWGTVRSTAKSIVMSFSLGRNIELPNQHAGWMVRQFFKNSNSGGHYKLSFQTPTSGWAMFEWDPVKTKPTAKSILRIGYRDKGTKFNQWISSFTFMPGVTQTLLSYHEATELIDAIRTVAKSAQLAATTP